MYKIDPRILDSTIYWYPSHVDAQQGNRCGGTGFLVDVSSETCIHMYAVTNWHVILHEQTPVIRLNTTQREFEILDLLPDSWIPHPDGDDVAICPIELDISTHKFIALPISMFITEQFVQTNSVGPGDDVFMIGRFVNHEGKQRNSPTIRFGNISMMPYESIRHPKFGIDQESFLAECRSLGGYSGSPVFWWFPHPEFGMGSIRVVQGPKLLGVDWCHIPDWDSVYQSDQKTRVAEKWQVRINTGMAAVIPAWRLADLLNTDKVTTQKRQKEQEAARKPA